MQDQMGEGIKCIREQALCVRMMKKPKRCFVDRTGTGAMHANDEESRRKVVKLSDIMIRFKFLPMSIPDYGRGKSKTTCFFVAVSTADWIESSFA